MYNLQEIDKEIFEAIRREEDRQENGLELAASENYVSKAVLEAMSTVLTNKYSEGYPGKRYYAGNEIIDEVETLAVERAARLFQAEHVNVQPLSGSPANSAVYLATVKPGDKVMGMKLAHGGHLSHGHPVNFSGMLYDFIQYGVDETNGVLNMDMIRDIALREKPRMIVVGFSAYSRNVDWRAFKDIADEIGAITFADIAHIAGLIAGKALENPVPIFDIVSTTTHKTLRGPRGAIIMCKEKFKKAIDRSVFPGIQGGPHDHITAAKAVCFKEALSPEFRQYARRVIQNAQVLSNALSTRGYKILTGGTDNHLFVIDMRNKKISGKMAEVALDKAGISCSRSTIPGDSRPALDPSGIRLGTPAVTTRGMGIAEMEILANLIDSSFVNHKNDAELHRIRLKVQDLCEKFPLYQGVSV
jgi:glycine hydroxymethyltransferase